MTFDPAYYRLFDDGLEGTKLVGFRLMIKQNESELKHVTGLENVIYFQ